MEKKQTCFNLFSIWVVQGKENSVGWAFSSLMMFLPWTLFQRVICQGQAPDGRPFLFGMMTTPCLTTSTNSYTPAQHLACSGPSIQVYSMNKWLESVCLQHQGLKYISLSGTSCDCCLTPLSLRAKCSLWFPSVWSWYLSTPQVPRGSSWWDGQKLTRHSSSPMPLKMGQRMYQSFILVHSPITWSA